MTELSFLIDLLLNERLQPKAKVKVQNRITEVEQNMSLPQAVKQYAKVQASLEPPIEVAQNAATSQALAARQAAISAAVNQKPIEISTGNGTKGPRKF